MEPYVIILLIVCGFGIAVVTTISGLGGGVFFVPFMVYFLAIPITEAREISQLVILCAATVSAVTYYRQKRVSLKVGFIGALCSVIGSTIFKSFFTFLNNDVVSACFGGFMIFVGVYYIARTIKARRKKRQAQATPIANFPTSQQPILETIGALPELGKWSWMKKTIPLFFLGGFLAAFFGVGGGILYVPTMNTLLSFPIHFATATSSFIIFFTSLTNVIIAGFRGQIDYLVGLLLAIGAVPGGRVGAKISQRIPKDGLTATLGSVMGIIGVMLLLGI